MTTKSFTKKVASVLCLGTLLGSAAMGDSVNAYSQDNETLSLHTFHFRTEVLPWKKVATGTYFNDNGSKLFLTYLTGECYYGMINGRRVYEDNNATVSYDYHVEYANGKKGHGRLTVECVHIENEGWRVKAESSTTSNVYYGRVNYVSNGGPNGYLMTWYAQSDIQWKL